MDKLEQLYNSLKSNPNIKGLPTDYATFKTSMQDEGTAQKFYDAIKSNTSVTGLPNDYETFSTALDLKKKSTPQQTTTAPLQNGGQPVSNNTPTTSTSEGVAPLDLLTGRWKQNLPQQNLQNNQQTVTPQQNNLANNEIGNWGNVNGGGRGGTVAPDDIDLNTKLKGGIRLKLAEQGVKDIVVQGGEVDNLGAIKTFKDVKVLKQPEVAPEYQWSEKQADGEIQSPNYSTGVTQQQITEKKKVPFEPTLTPPEPKTELDKKVQEVRSKYADTYWDEIQKNKDLYLDKNIQTKDGLVSLSQVDSYLDKDVRYTPSRLLDEHLDEVLNKDPNLNGADKFQIKKDIEARIGQLKTQEDVVKLAGVIYQDKSGKIAPDLSLMLAPDMMQKISDDTKINAEQIVDNAKNVSAKNLYDQYSTGKITKQQYSDGIDKLNDDVNLKLDALYKGAEESAKQSLSGLGLSEQDLKSYSKSYGDAYGDYLVAKNKESYNVWKNYDGITKLSKGIDLGVYQMMESVGGMMAQQGMYDLADNITKTTGQITEGMQVPNMGAMEWESLSDPVWWATHAVPSATSSALFMIPSIGIGVATGGLGLGLIGQGAIAGVANRTLESYTESGDTFNQAIKNGMSVEDASKAAAKVWKDNMYLTGLDAMQMALLFTPMGSTVAKIAKGVVEAGTEAGEEIYQSYSSSKALGQFEGNIIDFAKSPEGIESGFLGALLGVTTSGLSDSFKLKEGTETQAQTQKMYNMLMQDGGENIPKRASYIRTMIGDMVMNGSMTPEESKTALNTLAFVQHNLEDSKGDITKKQVEELGLKYYQVKLKDEIKNAKTDYEKESKQEKLDNVEAFILDSKDKTEPIELTPTKTEDVSAQPSEEVGGKVSTDINTTDNTNTILEKSKGTIYERLAESIKGALTNLKTTVTDAFKSDVSEHGDYGQNEITINNKTNKNKLHIFFHEALHHITRGKIEEFEKNPNSKNLTSDEVQAIINIKRIFKQVSERENKNRGGYGTQKGDGGIDKNLWVLGDRGTDRGFTNVHEFVSEAFTNPEFQKILKEFATEGKSPTIFKQFLDAVSKLLGIKDTSILDDIFHHTEKLLDGEKSEVAPNPKEETATVTEAPKEEVAPEIVKTKDFKSDEGNFSVYNVKGSDGKNGDVFTVHKSKDGWVVRNANVPKELQKKGIATDFYQKMNEESIKATGKPLRSTQPRTLISGETVHELSKEGVTLWDSLVKKGLAEKLGEKDYRFKSAPEQKVEAPIPDVPLVEKNELTAGQVRDKLQEIEKQPVKINITQDANGKMEQTSQEVIANIKTELDKTGLPYSDVVANDKGSTYFVVTKDGQQHEILRVLKSGEKLVPTNLTKAKWINHLIKTERDAVVKAVSESTSQKSDVPLEGEKNVQGRFFKDEIGRILEVTKVDGNFVTMKEPSTGKVLKKRLGTEEFNGLKDVTDEVNAQYEKDKKNEDYLSVIDKIKNNKDLSKDDIKTQIEMQGKLPSDYDKNVFDKLFSVSIKTADSNKGITLKNNVTGETHFIHANELGYFGKLDGKGDFMTPEIFKEVFENKNKKVASEIAYKNKLQEADYNKSNERFKFVEDNFNNIVGKLKELKLLKVDC